MGHGTEARVRVTIVADEMEEDAEPIEGHWRLTIIHGPTMVVQEAFTEIELEVHTEDGRRSRFTIDPDAPTIETFTRLAASTSPILQALFQGSTRMLVD